MLTPLPSDALHRGWLFRLLTAICEQPFLSQHIGFKGGTCAAMRGFLNRFSIDLDFDLLIEEKEMVRVKENLEKVFHSLELKIKDGSMRVPQYYLSYPLLHTASFAPRVSDRSTIKVDVCYPPLKENDYEMVALPEIDRVVRCQTLPTMFANKLIALIDRYENRNKIAGRDLYDVHQFFLQGFSYKKEIILARRKSSLVDFFQELINLVQREVSSTTIDQDLNTLLPYKEFRMIRKILKQESITLLTDELKRLKNN